VHASSAAVGSQPLALADITHGSQPLALADITSRL